MILSSYAKPCFHLKTNSPLSELVGISQTSTSFTVLLCQNNTCILGASYLYPGAWMHNICSFIPNSQMIHCQDIKDRSYTDAMCSYFKPLLFLNHFAQKPEKPEQNSDKRANLIFIAALTVCTKVPPLYYWRSEGKPALWKQIMQWFHHLAQQAPASSLLARAAAMRQAG